MKLIKLSSDHYIIVDESKQPVEGSYYDNFVKDIRDTSGAEYGQADHCWQITHSTKAMYKDEYISLSEVKELLGEVDVEKKAYDTAFKFIGTNFEQVEYLKSLILEFYNQAIEDNKDRRFTKEDMRKAMDLHKNTSIPLDDIIQSLQPPTSWDVEFVDGKLKLIEIVKNK